MKRSARSEKRKFDKERKLNKVLNRPGDNFCCQEKAELTSEPITAIEAILKKTKTSRKRNLMEDRRKENRGGCRKLNLQEPSAGRVSFSLHSTSPSVQILSKL